MSRYRKPQAVKYIFFIPKVLGLIFIFLLNLSAVRLHALSGEKENGALVWKMSLVNTFVK